MFFVRVAQLRRLAITAIVAAACFGPVASAPAQFGGQAGFAEAFRPDFLARDIILFTDALGLEEWQRPIIETLLEDYQVSFNAGVEDVRKKMSDMKDQISSAPPEEVMKRILAPIDAWSAEKAKLRTEFLDNVKSQLSEAQLERWSRFERAFRREKTLDHGEIQGESVNQLAILKEMQLDPAVARLLEPALDEFETQLDTALAARERAIEAQQAKVKDAMSKSDHESGIVAMEAIMVTRVGVRKAQDEGRVAVREAIAKTAGDATADDFARKVLERAYPKVYRSDPILPLFENARNLEGITEEQKAALNDLEARYKVEIVTVNETLADAYRSEEPKEPRRRVELMLARQEGAEAVARARAESEVIVNARKAREEVYDRYRKAIMDILNEDQKKQMPFYGKGDRIPPDMMEERREEKSAGRRQAIPDSRLGTGQSGPTGGHEKPSREKGEESRRQQIGNNAPRRESPSDRPAGRGSPPRQE